MSVGQLELEALKLSLDERARLAERLLKSLEIDPAIEQAWADEIERRCREIDDGTAELVPVDEFLASIHSKSA